MLLQIIYINQQKPNSRVIFACETCFPYILKTENKPTFKDFIYSQNRFWYNHIFFQTKTLHRKSVDFFWSFLSTQFVLGTFRVKRVFWITSSISGFSVFWEADHLLFVLLILPYISVHCFHFDLPSKDCPQDSNCSDRKLLLGQLIHHWLMQISSPDYYFSRVIWNTWKQQFSFYFRLLCKDLIFLFFSTSSYQKYTAYWV